jgi:predicted kinase
MVIVSCTAPDAELRARIVGRERLGTDASEAGLEVLAHQRAASEPPSREEVRDTVEFDTARPCEEWGPLLERVAERLGIQAWNPGE